MHTKVILVVEEQAAEQKALAAMVEELGFKCLICSDGQAAIILLKKQYALIDLVLLDLVLSGIDGISALGHLKGHYPLLPVIAFAAEEEKDAVAQALRWGANNVLLKPFNTAQLGTVIDNALSGLKTEPYSRIAKN